MVVRIRLARFGKCHAPVYNIVVQQARTARDRKPMEVLGTYDPIPKPAPDGGKPIKDIQLDVVRAKYWLGVGAQPSDPVWRLLAMFGLIEPKWTVARIAAVEAARRAGKAKPPKNERALAEAAEAVRAKVDAQWQEEARRSDVRWGMEAETVQS